jgi:hypothetical protein
MFSLFIKKYITIDNRYLKHFLENSYLSFPIIYHEHIELLPAAIDRNERIDLSRVNDHCIFGIGMGSNRIILRLH